MSSTGLLRCAAAAALLTFSPVVVRADDLCGESCGYRGGKATVTFYNWVEECAADCNTEGLDLRDITSAEVLECICDDCSWHMGQLQRKCSDECFELGACSCWSCDSEEWYCYDSAVDTFSEECQGGVDSYDSYYGNYCTLAAGAVPLPAIEDHAVCSERKNTDGMYTFSGSCANGYVVDPETYTCQPWMGATDLGSFGRRLI